MTRCTSWRRLSGGLVAAENGSTEGYVDSAVQCLLFGRHAGRHFGFLDSLEHGLGLWIGWLEAEPELVDLPDCSETGPEPDPAGCCLFVGHVERHTWEAPL